MKCRQVWEDTILNRESQPQPIYDLCFNPDGSQLIACAGPRVLVYDASDGDFLQTLKAHKDSVFSVSYTRDGKRFASGSADNTVIIWSSKLDPVLRYKHNDAVQCVSFNPMAVQLCSCTETDFAFWSPDVKSVVKHKVPSRIVSCSWTNDGQFVALGMFNGTVSIRGRNGEEKVRIERGGPAWTLSWNPSTRDLPYETLGVGDWSGKLAFFQLSGRSVGREIRLGYDPCAMGYFTTGDYFAMGGSDRKSTLWTRDGVQLAPIAERADWVWTTRHRPKHNQVAVGCNDGTISMHEVNIGVVHGMYKDRYAYRENMTEVIIQDLVTEQKVKIKCRDYVKRIAIYKDMLAVQLPERVTIYQDEEHNLQYKLKEKIMKKMDCNLLVVTSNNVILCLERKLQLYDLSGEKVREWSMDSLIRYIKVIGGPFGREGLLVGLRSGQISKIFINNQFPITLIQHDQAIRCLDMNKDRSKLALVDDALNVVVYDLQSKSQVYKHGQAYSVAWNLKHSDMFCYTGHGQLHIKASDFAVHTQKMQGHVVGFMGSKIFCLHGLHMKTIDVPQSTTMSNYLSKGDYASAHQIACLGVTDDDWRLLATKALNALELEIARKAFIRVKDMRFIELLDRIQPQLARPGVRTDAFRAEILAYQGKYSEAADLYTGLGDLGAVITMFSDLGLWNEAKKWIKSFSGRGNTDAATMSTLSEKLANMCEEHGDAKAASQLWIEAQKYERAVRLMAENRWTEDLIEVVRSMNKNTEQEALSMAAAYFREVEEHEYATETYLKMGDVESLMRLHVTQNRWDEAFALAKQNSVLTPLIYRPYAKYLAMHDRFEEAQEAFVKAGRPDEAIRVLEQLTHNAVVESRFDDASYYFWILATQHLRLVEGNGSREDQKHQKLHNLFSLTSNLYKAYGVVHNYVEQPFTSTNPLALFRTARFLFVHLGGEAPLGIKHVNVLWTLAKTAKTVGAYKLARQCYERLSKLNVPRSWHDAIDLANITTRSMPYADDETLMPICPRCATTNSLAGSHGDRCSNCKHAFVRSFIGYDTLHLVEFFPERGLEEKEVKELLNTYSFEGDKEAGRGARGSSSGGADRLVMDEEDDGYDDLMDDEFTKRLMQNAEEPLYCSREMLRALKPNEVFVLHWPDNVKGTQYFRNMFPEDPVTVCETCNHFFRTEDHEQHALSHHKCPFCRTELVDPTNELSMISDY